MTVSLIAAVAANRVIGNAGALPWRLSDDMRRFARITVGHPVVMGRATFESLRKPLAGRRCIVLTRSTDRPLPGCEAVHSVEEAVAVAAIPGEMPQPLEPDQALRARTAKAPHAAPSEALVPAFTAPPPDELFVIGGAEVYRQFLPIARRMYITWIDADVRGDVFFPDISFAEWRVTGEWQANPDPKGSLPHRFVDYERKEL